MIPRNLWFSDYDWFTTRVKIAHRVYCTDIAEVRIMLDAIDKAWKVQRRYLVNENDGQSPR